VAVEEARLIVEVAAPSVGARRLLLARAALRPADLQRWDARLPRASFDRLLEEAVRMSGDRDLGLHAAERAGNGHRLPEPLQYGLDACATVGDQLRMAARYVGLLHADATATFSADGRVAWLTYELRSAGAVARRHMAERWLGALVILVRRQAGDGFEPHEVRFAHAATPDTSTHERIFRAPLRFEQEIDAVAVGREVLDVPVRDGDPGLHRVLDAYLATILPAVQPASLSELVRRRIRAGPPGRRPDLATVASALAMSPRTLQRGLAGERTTYHAVLAEVREDLARQLLTESRLSVSEIAFVVGFSDVSTFHRAFKRWTDQTPRAFRRARGAPLAPLPIASSGVLRQPSGAQGQDFPSPARKGRRAGPSRPVPARRGARCKADPDGCSRAWPSPPSLAASRCWRPPWRPRPPSAPLSSARAPRT